MDGWWFCKSTRSSTRSPSREKGSGGEPGGGDLRSRRLPSSYCIAGAEVHGSGDGGKGILDKGRQTCIRGSFALLVRPVYVGDERRAGVCDMSMPATCRCLHRRYIHT